MIDVFITSKVPDDGIPSLEDFVGRIQLIDTPAGTQAQKLLETAQKFLETKDAATLKLVPYGHGERNENGEITKFELTGFTLVI
jgi:hypothetical protein